MILQVFRQFCQFCKEATCQPGSNLSRRSIGGGRRGGVGPGEEGKNNETVRRPSLEFFHSSTHQKAKLALLCVDVISNSKIK